MVNKTQEAFKDWLKFISVELTGMDLKIAEAAWQAAISYMQEQSEPVAWMEVKEDDGYKEIKVWQEPVSKKSIPLYTTPQRQQPLKRLNYERLEILWMNVVDSLPECSPEMAFANAIMDTMQEINK